MSFINECIDMLTSNINQLEVFTDFLYNIERYLNMLYQLKDIMYYLSIDKNERPLFNNLTNNHYRLQNHKCCDLNSYFYSYLKNTFDSFYELSDDDFNYNLINYNKDWLYILFDNQKVIQDNYEKFVESLNNKLSFIDYKKHLLFFMNNGFNAMLYEDDEDYNLLSMYDIDKINEDLLNKILNVNFKDINTYEVLILFIMNNFYNFNDDDLKLIFYYAVFINKILLFCLNNLQ